MFQFEPYFFLQLHLSFLSLKFFCFTLEYRWFTVLCCFFLIIIFFVSFSPCLFTSHSSSYHSLVQCINWLCFFVKGMPCALRLYLCHYLIIALIFFQIFNLRSFLFLFFTFVVGSYHSVHSITLILGNPKMKQNAKTLLLLRKWGQWERTLMQSKNRQFGELTEAAQPPSAKKSLFTNLRSII